jgi:hypothetical protein
MVALAVPIPFLGREALASTFADDAFYYFQIARNVSSGKGLTFDSVHPTNGFQPLWLFLLVAVFKFVSGDVWPLRVVALVEAGLIAVAAAGVFRVLHGRIGTGPALVAAISIVALPGSPSVFRTGMESSLLLCLFVFVWERWLALSEAGPPSTRGCLGLGLLSGLAFLARIEAIVFVLALLILGARRWRADVKSLIALLTPPVLIVASYAAWSGLVFGTMLPISGVVKVHWVGEESLASSLRWSLDPPWIYQTMVCRLFGEAALLDCPPVALVLYGSLVVLALAFGWCFRDTLRVVVRQSAAGFIFLAGGLMVIADLLSVHYLETWYQGPIMLSIAVLVGSLLSQWRRLTRLAVATVVLVAVARVPMTAWRVHDPTASYAYYRIQAADWARENTATSDRIGSWNAGTFGYFSHRRVVNLHGLVNDVDYFRRVIERKNLEGYLRSERITWLADQACGADSRPTAYLALTASEHLDAEFDLVVHFFRANADDGCPGFAIWHRSRPDAPSRSEREQPR